MNIRLTHNYKSLHKGNFVKLIDNMNKLIACMCQTVTRSRDPYNNIFAYLRADRLKVIINLNEYLQ